MDRKLSVGRCSTIILSIIFSPLMIPFAEVDVAAATASLSPTAISHLYICDIYLQVSVLVQDRNAVPLADIEIYGRANINGTNYTTSRGMTQPNGQAFLNVAGGTWNIGVECYRAESRGYSCPPIRVSRRAQICFLPCNRCRQA